MQRRIFLRSAALLPAVGAAASKPAAPTTEFLTMPAAFCPHCLDQLYCYVKQNLSDDGSSLISREYIYEHQSHPGCPNSGKKYVAALPKVQLQEMR